MNLREWWAERTESGDGTRQFLLLPCSENVKRPVEHVALVLDWCEGWVGVRGVPERNALFVQLVPFLGVRVQFRVPLRDGTVDELCRRLSWLREHHEE